MEGRVGKGRKGKGGGKVQGIPVLLFPLFEPWLCIKATLYN